MKRKNIGYVLTHGAFIRLGPGMGNRHAR